MASNSQQPQPQGAAMVRWLRITVACCFLLACANLWLLFELYPRATDQTTLTAGELRIVNDAGELLMHLVGNSDEPGFFFKDSQLRDRLVLLHDDEQSGLFIKDSNGDSRIGIAQFAHGGGGVALHGEELKGAAVLYYKTAGTLTFYGEDGAVLQRVPRTVLPEIPATP